jgi:micrococcal nuclease
MRLIATVLVALAVLTQATPRHGVVERVIDGDTVVLTGIGHVRLIGVDTPESKHPQKPVEAYAREATAFLEQLVLRQTVRLEYDQPGRDRYGRLLAYLRIEDGRDVSAEIIKQGYGFAYVKYPFARMQEYRALERQARDAGRGLWAERPEGSK